MSHNDAPLLPKKSPRGLISADKFSGGKGIPAHLGGGAGTATTVLLPPRPKQAKLCIRILYRPETNIVDRQLYN